MRVGRELGIERHGDVDEPHDKEPDVSIAPELENPPEVLAAEGFDLTRRARLLWADR
jgi:hypothetical protein